MGDIVFFDTLREGLWAATLISAPVLGIALAVGLLIGLLQALTSIQEMTLTFVPKIVVVLFIASLSAPFMASQINLLAKLTFSKISGGI